MCQGWQTTKEPDERTVMDYVWHQKSCYLDKSINSCPCYHHRSSAFPKTPAGLSKRYYKEDWKWQLSKCHEIHQSWLRKRIVMWLFLSSLMGTKIAMPSNLWAHITCKHRLREFHGGMTNPDSFESIKHLSIQVLMYVKTAFFERECWDFSQSPLLTWTNQSFYSILALCTLYGNIADARLAWG